MNDSFCFPGMNPPLADNREPHYVILMNGKLDQIGISVKTTSWRVAGELSVGIRWLI
jgi:hypothetical protein